MQLGAQPYRLRCCAHYRYKHHLLHTVKAQCRRLQKYLVAHIPNLAVLHKGLTALSKMQCCNHFLHQKLCKKGKRPHRAHHRCAQHALTRKLFCSQKISHSLTRCHQLLVSGPLGPSWLGLQSDPSYVKSNGFAISLGLGCCRLVLQAKAILNAVSAVPQLEQADKLLTRLPQAKWAADVRTSTSMLSAFVSRLLLYCNHMHDTCCPHISACFAILAPCARHVLQVGWLYKVLCNYAAMHFIQALNAQHVYTEATKLPLTNSLRRVACLVPCLSQGLVAVLHIAAFLAMLSPTAWTVL